MGTFPLLLLFEVFPHKDIIIAKNRNNESARTQTQRLIRTAKNEILILSYSLNPNIYNDIAIIRAFENAAKRGVYIKGIVSSNGFNKRHNKKSLLRKLVEESVINILEINEDKNPDFFRKINHFMVVDGEYYRLEKLHSDTDSNDRSAVIGYLPSKALELRKIFFKIEEKLVNISLIPEVV